MKRLFATILFLNLGLILLSQTKGVSINNTGNDPDNSAILDVQSTNKGILIPRMDSISRKAIINPAEGLMVYDSTTTSFWYFRDLAWTELAPSKNLKDTDGDTRIEVENTPDEDLIRMTTAGKERFRIDSTGFVSSGTYNYGYTGAFPDSGPGTRMMWVPTQVAFRVGVAYSNDWDPGNVGFGSTITGGEGNKAPGSYSFIGNGDVNQVSGKHTSVLNGEGNISSGNYSTVIGGSDNTASAKQNVITGGSKNFTSGTYAFIGNGNQNLVSGQFSSIVGGNKNLATGDSSFIGGGTYNIASANLSAISGGNDNLASGVMSAIVGGYRNSISGDHSFIGGGSNNIASGNFSTVSGGQRNHTQGHYSSILGGIDNIAFSYGETVVGINSDIYYTPQSTTAYHPEDRVFSVGNGIGGYIRSNALTILKSGRIGAGTTHPDSTALLDLSSSNKGLLIPRMTSTNRLAIAGPAEGLIVYDSTANNFQYFSNGSWNPLNNSVAGGPIDQIIDTDGDTRIEVENAPDEDRIRLLAYGQERLLIDTSGLVSSGTYFPGYNGVLPDSGAGTRLIWIPAKAAFRVGRATGPEWNKAFIGDFSTVTGGEGNMAAGRHATIAGGETNNAPAIGSSVLGGFQNRAAGNYSSVSGGSGNLASNTYAYVTGGSLNVASGVAAFAGGLKDTVSGYASVIVGGELNKAFGDSSFIGGGSRNLASGAASFVGGGVQNRASNLYSFVGGGLQNNNIGEQASIVGGYQNIATATQSFIGGGSQNFTSGVASSIGAGFFNYATGAYSSIVGGQNNTALGKLSFVGGGAYNAALSYGEAVLGLFSENNYIPYSADTFNTQDRLFVVGNGSSPFARSNALTLLKSGNLGLGTSNPDTTLHLVGKLKYQDGSQQDGYILTSDAQGQASWQPSSKTDTIWSKNGNHSIYSLHGSHIVTGANSLVAGTNNIVAGDLSFVVGKDNVLDKNRNYAFGLRHKMYMSSGTGFAFGVNDTLADYANQAFAFGQGNFIRSALSGAFGLENRITDFFGGPSYAIGMWNHISSGRGVAIGYGLRVPGYNEFVIGTFNEQYTPLGGGSDRLFSIGNGASGSRSNALTILQNGSMGIGTSTPHSSAILDATSTEKGILIPRMSSIERQNIATPTEGLMVYDTTTTSFWFFSTTWKEIGLDNLGTHTATQNLQLGSNWLSGDGDNEGIFVDNSGKVGINTSSPGSFQLQVNGSIQFGGFGTGDSNEVAKTVWLRDMATNWDEYLIKTSSASGAGIFNRQGFGIHMHGSRQFGFWSSNYDQLFTVQGATGNTYIKGTLGIGTTASTKAKLEVNGTGAAQNNTYAYLDYSGGIVTGVFTGSRSYSIWASNEIAAAEFHAISDLRVKNVRGVSDGGADLKTLMDIQITDYTFKDSIAKSNRPMKKVIAQQVVEVYPQAVKTNTTEVVPDIYQRADMQEGWIMLATDLQAGERVKLITEESSEVYEVLEVEATRFKVADMTSRSGVVSPLASQVFVYGREVEDFHTVDYEAISMLNVSATQEQQKLIETLKIQIEDLKAERQTFEKRLQVLEAMIMGNNKMK